MNDQGTLQHTVEERLRKYYSRYKIYLISEGMQLKYAITLT